MANLRTPSLVEVTLKAAIVHTATYFVMGLFALVTFNYAQEFATGSLAGLMRDIGDPMIAAGPLFQPIRGILFGVCFYAVRDVVFARPRGWLTMWLLLVVLGILNTFGPAPGSIEGAIYTTLPLLSHVSLSMIEVYGQSLLLALGVYYWVRQPANRLLGWSVTGIAALAVLMSLAGIFLAPMAN